MKLKTLFAAFLSLVLFAAGRAQAPDKAKLDQFFDRLAEKNQAMETLAFVKNGDVLTREGTTLFIQPGSQSAAALEATAPDKFQLGAGRIVFEFDAAKKPLIHKRGGPPRVFTKD